MAFAGLRGTGSWGTDERPKNFRELILWADPNGTAPLYALMAKARKESTDDPEFAWWEEKLEAVRLTVDGTGASSSSTALGVTAGGLNVVPGDVLMVEKTELATYDNEIVTVSSVTSDTAIVIKRGQAGSSAAAIPAGAFLTKIGSAFQEGTGAPNFSTRNPTKLKNFTQIFKTAMGITGTAQATHARTGEAWANDKKRKAFDHASSIEFALMFGQAYEDTTGSQPIRYMGGLREFITTNVKIYTTTPTEDVFLDDVYKVFNYSAMGAGTERLVLAGNGFLNGLNKLARNSSSTRINFQGTLKVYGMELQKWVLPQGTLGVRTHPLMNLHPRFTNSAFILCPPGLRWRPLRGRDTKFMDNIQNNDEDTRKAQWLTEGGLEVNHEQTMGYLGNFVV